MRGTRASGRSLNVNVYYSDGTVERITLTVAATLETVRFVTAEGKTLVTIFTGRGTNGRVTLYYESCGVFEGVVSAEEFETYVGATYPITFPASAGTVYGGTLTDNGDGTWTLTVTHILAAVRWGDVSGTAYGDYVRKDFAGAFAQNVSIDSTINSTCCINNIGANYLSKPTSAELHYYIRNNTSLRVFLPSTTDNDFIFQATGYLMIPQTYTLAAESVETLLGDNNIFADCGNINTLVYRKNINAVIDEAIAGS